MKGETGVMYRLRRWTAVAGALGLCGLGFACLESRQEDAPSAREREARSEVLRELMASRERLPSPGELEAQRRELHAEVGQAEPPARGGAGRARPEASITATVEWVGDDELLLRDARGVERDVRVAEDTRFLRGGREVSRRSVEQGAEIRVAYDVEQGEWVALEVELLREPAPSSPRQSRAGGAMSRPSLR
jgi:hypothetical protein